MNTYIRNFIHRASRWLLYINQDSFLTQVNYVSKIGQVALSLQQLELHRVHGIVPSFQDVGFRVFSQNDEDGILLFIFALLGTTNRTAVEICAGNGIECNTANLTVFHGWRTLMFDGDQRNIAKGTDFYRNCMDTYLQPPTLVKAWLTRENINQLISENGFEGEIDLLSLDMDGVDYWIWDAITIIEPRVVVLEFQSVWGALDAVTVPYRPDFSRGESSDYYGASLPAFVNLGRQKGYRLVGFSRNTYNAFFIRNDLGSSIFPEIAAEACMKFPEVQNRVARSLPRVRDREWIKV